MPHLARIINPQSNHLSAFFSLSKTYLCDPDEFVSYNKDESSPLDMFHQNKQYDIYDFLGLSLKF